MNEYSLFLNGRFYGQGDLKYINELMHDYIVVCELYGHDEVEFKVIKETNK